MAIEIEDKLNVFWNNEKVGTLYRIFRKNKIRLLFSYSDTWEGNPISLSLPIPDERNELILATNFFKFLLFEESQKEIICGRLGINETDNFTLLKNFGKDCAGALQILPDGIYSETERTVLRDVTSKVEEHIKSEAIYRDNKILTPNLFLDCKARLSLAGNQDKLPCVYKDGKVYVPDQGMTTHILKTPSRRFQNLPENEYICMKLAKKIGFDVPDCDLIKIADKWCYLVERYDRKNNQRLHQEDFAQALGLDKKYQDENGPSIKSCMSVIDKYDLSDNDKEKFIKFVIFNYCIGNTDAHGRNYSILIPKHGQAKLAPLYDLICSLVYPLDRKVAMSIGNTFVIDKIREVSWQGFCKDVDISIKEFDEYRTEIVDKINQELLGVIVDLINKKTHNEDPAWAIGHTIMNFTNKLEKLDFNLEASPSFS